jgi:CubicO group peptidase (beta-lactamase class C family)
VLSSSDRARSRRRFPHVSGPPGPRRAAPSIRGGRRLRRAARIGLTTASLLLAGGGWAAAADAEPWVARHGLTSARYQAEFDTWVRAGYRLTSVSGYDQGGSARYAAIWRKASGPAWQARHGLTSAQYQATFDDLRARGYRPIVVNGYEVAGTVRYAAIFIQDSSVAWVARHGLTSAQYQAQSDALVAQGYRLRHVSGYSSGGAARYAAVWERRSGPAWRAFHGLESERYQALFDAMVAQGYHLSSVSGYRADGADRYAGLFEAGASRPWAARHGLRAGAYQDAVDDLRLQGYGPLQVSAFARAGGPRFALLWENDAFAGQDLQTIDSAVDRAMTASKTVGLSLAIATEGRLVFAKSYGLADQSAGAPMHRRHRFRMASVSKPITALEIMHLAELGRLHLDNHVFGPGSLLGDSFKPVTGYADNRVVDITVRELLEHTGGGWDNDGGDGSDDPMFTQPALGADALITSVLAGTPLEFAPGTTYQYSNFGYCILGRIIERLTGKSYADAVRDDILAPSGAGSFAIGGNTAPDRLPDEVVYHQVGTGGGDPYGMQVRRMDAHGGWIATPVDVLRVAVRADGFATVPDLLNADSMATMTTPTTAMTPAGDPAIYAKGWAVNDIPNWWHNGFLPGTRSMLLRTAKRYGPATDQSFVAYAVVNSTNADSSRDVDLDTMLWNILRGVRAWPSYDLF